MINEITSAIEKRIFTTSSFIIGSHFDTLILIFKPFPVLLMTNEKEKYFKETKK